jgi:site-specific DNA-methyltransferase (adenine-specific)
MIAPDWISDDGSVSLYMGDCLSILPELAAGSVDAVVTDPPYGVNLGKHGAANEKRPQFLAKKAYESYDDTPENYETLIVPRINAAIALAGRGLVFAAGTQMWSLPRPDAVGSVFLPAGCGRNRWGFQCHAHFVLYGKCPDLHKGAKPTGWSSTERADKSEHPCPKPTAWMERCVLLASREAETILDPFMGSGTTGVACVRTGRKFIGIELEPKYFEIAKARIQKALADKAEQLPLVGVA